MGEILDDVRSRHLAGGGNSDIILLDPGKELRLGHRCTIEELQLNSLNQLLKLISSLRHIFFHLSLMRSSSFALLFCLLSDAAPKGIL
jgi:hypothetical protein